MATEAKNKARDTAEHVRDTASSVAERARDTASSLAGQTRDAASSAARTAGNVASNLGERADEATTSVGSGMQSLAGSIRGSAPQGGVMGTAASKVADALESSGRYLQEHGVRDIGNDLANLIRRNPIPSLLVGIGIGYLIARATRS
jgi:hypothetical protein